MQWIWVHVVLQVKDNNENSQQPVIVCTNQVLRYGREIFKRKNFFSNIFQQNNKMYYSLLEFSTIVKKKLP